MWEFTPSDFRIVGGGFVYFAVALVIPFLSLRPRARDQNRIFLAVAYLALIICFLNFFGAYNKPLPNNLNTILALLILVLYAGLQVLVLILAILNQNLRSPSSAQAKAFVSGALVAGSVAWIFAVGLVGGGVLELNNLRRTSPSVSLSDFKIVLVFAALFSGMLGYVLTRKVGLPSVRRGSALAFLCGLLLVAGLNEYFVRGNWLLFSLSAAAFAGVFFSAWEALAFVSRQNSSEGGPVEVQAGD